MTKKKVAKVDETINQSLPDILKNASISICVVLDELRALDPNDYYDRWFAQLDSLLTVAEVLQAAHKQCDKYVRNVRIQLPPDVLMVTYKQTDMFEESEGEDISHSPSAGKELGDVPF